MTPETEKYFEEQNIQVYFDTLGKTKALKEAYIESTQKLVDANPTKRSEMVKHACYSQFYSMKQREKLTGFEQFAELDKQYRIENREYIGENVFRMSNLFEKSEKSSIILPYKTQLGRSFEEYNKPILLYLSGGLDSELVARSLIEFGINFTPVIFNWGNKKGEIVNSTDTQYAFDLCKEFQLTPIVKTVNIDELWLSAEFKRLGKAIRILSPHLTTHAYMVELMNTEKPNHIHLLGGEVRYKSDASKFNDEKFINPNLVYANKINPITGYSNTFNISKQNVFGFSYTMNLPVWDPFVSNWADSGSIQMQFYNNGAGITSASRIPLVGLPNHSTAYYTNANFAFYPGLIHDTGWVNGTISNNLQIPLWSYPSLIVGQNITLYNGTFSLKGADNGIASCTVVLNAVMLA